MNVGKNAKIQFTWEILYMNERKKHTHTHPYIYSYLYKMQTCLLQWTSASTTWMWYLTIMLNTLFFISIQQKNRIVQAFFFFLSNSFIWILLVLLSTHSFFFSSLFFFARSSYFHWANLTLELFLSFSLPIHSHSVAYMDHFSWNINALI